MRMGIVMSSVLSISKGLMWQKFKLMNLVLLFNIVVILLVFSLGNLGGFFRNEYALGKIVFSTSLICLLGIILLAWANEKVLRDNRYRLIPISDWMLYLSNFGTTCLAYLYLGIVEVVTLLSLFSVNGPDKFLVEFGYVIRQISPVEMTLLFLGVMLIWSVCTLMRLGLEWLNNVLPYRSQIVAQITLGVAMTAFSYWLFTITSFAITIAADHLRMNNDSNLFVIAIMVDVIALIILNLLNIFLFKKFAETSK